MGSDGDNNETSRKKMEIKSNEKIAEENLTFQRENLDYQKALQQQLFQREDSNIQRQVADARAAGVSPLAVSLTGGTAGSEVATTAPHNDNRVDMMSGMSSDAQKAQMLINAISSITGTIEQVQSISRQKMENEYLSRTLDSRVSQQYGAEILQSYERADARTKAYYNQIYGIHSGMSETERKIQLLKGTLGLVTHTDGANYNGRATTPNGQGTYHFKSTVNGQTYHLDDNGIVPNYAQDNLEELLGKVVNKSTDYVDKILDSMKPKKKDSVRGQLNSAMQWLFNHYLGNQDILMSKFVFNDDTVKQLAYYSKQLYQTFSLANKQLLEHKERSMASDFHIDYITTPWNFYYYMDSDVQIRILKLDQFKKVNIFTLEMYNVKTDLKHCDKISETLELYNHCYGTFYDINVAISVFKSIVARLSSQYTGNEYDVLAEYTHKKLLSKIEAQR